MDALTLKKFGHVRIVTKKLGFEFFMADLVKNGHFLGSGMTYDRVLFVLLESRVISDPKKWPFFTKSALKNSNPLLVKISTCPNSLIVRASTDVKSGQKFQLEPG